MLITQGKTNWKFLLIIILVAFIMIIVIVGLSYWFFQYRKPDSALIPKFVVSKEKAVKELFAEKYNKSLSEVAINVTKENEDHMVGGVTFEGEKQDEETIFLAAKINDTWKLVYDDRGEILCSVISPYNFPVDMVSECVEQDGSLRKRIEEACIDSGGTILTSLCCKSTDDFPNLCLIGACGCLSENSHQVKVCDCGTGKCFDGKECKTREGDAAAADNQTSTGEASGGVNETCSAGWKCKDNNHRAYQETNCSWKDEIFCQFGCKNGECQPDPCKNVKCPDKCAGDTRKYNGVCVGGQCQYTELLCQQGCENGTCKDVGDPCSGIVCQNICDGNTRKYNGTCSNGQCQYSTENCQFGCENTICKSDPCTGINCPDICDGNNRKYSGSCTNGVCQYSTEGCQFGCESGTCKADSCAGISCPDKCEGDARKYNGVCSNGQCGYSSLQCQFGCENGLCKGDPCAGVTCPNLCDGSTRKYSGSCSGGQCQYSTESCQFGCTNGTCNPDPCVNVTCPSTNCWMDTLTTWQCVNGTCQSSAQSCPNGCNDLTQCLEYSCNYIWYQEIIHKNSGTPLWRCTSQRPYCKAGTSNCCKVVDPYANPVQYYDCIDCIPYGHCTDLQCVGVTCPSHCKNTTTFYKGICIGGSCLSEVNNCSGVCTSSGCVPLYVGAIFVTNSTWNANLGGLTGADQKCQTAAQAVGLTGTWKALLSDSSTNAIDRIPDVVFKKLDGTTIAGSKADLFDGSILSAINLTETLSLVGDFDPAWTGSGSAGQKQLTIPCDNWTVSSGTNYAFYGRADRTDSTWIQLGLSGCGFQYHLYCVLIAI